MKTLKVSGNIVPVKENNKFSLNKWDWLKALLIAISAPVVDYLIQAISGGFSTIDWQRVASIAASAALVYLSKNFFSKSTVVIEKKDL